jgi:hypothetical protein
MVVVPVVVVAVLVVVAVTGKHSVLRLTRCRLRQ